jgi:hypothetical protein
VAVTRTTDAQFRAARLAHDLADDVPPLCRRCHAERGERCRKHPECEIWEREPCDGCRYAATRPAHRCGVCDENPKSKERK